MKEMLGMPTLSYKKGIMAMSNKYSLFCMVFLVSIYFYLPVPVVGETCLVIRNYIEQKEEQSYFWHF